MNKRTSSRSTLIHAPPSAADMMQGHVAQHNPPASLTITARGPSIDGS